MKYKEVKASELQVGMIVNTHGMRVRLDSKTEHPDYKENGLPCFSHRGTILNRDEVPTHLVPLSFTERTGPNGTRFEGEQKYDYWNVQSNDLVTWAVETCGESYAWILDGKAVSCELASGHDGQHENATFDAPSTLIWD